MLTATNTNAVSFVFNNLQAVLQSNTNGNSIGVVPLVQAMERQSAMSITGRLPGGTSYRGLTNSVSPSTANAAILLDDIVTSAAFSGCVKNGAFVVALSGTTPVTVPLTNTATNTNGQAGDTLFASWNMLIFRNLSGTDNTNSASLTVAPAATNGAVLQFLSGNTTGLVMTIDGSSGHCLQSVNGVAINASKAAITITPTATCNFACVICGA